MRTKLQKLLNSFGYKIVSTKFGICGDWLVIDSNGNGQFFVTLADVRAFAKTLTNNSKKEDEK